MRQMFRAVLLTVALALPGLNAAHAQALNEEAVRPVLRAAVEEFLRPGYRSLDTAAAKMTEEIGALCDGPDQDRLTAARTAFGKAVEGWSRMETVRFGPVLRDNAAERIYFFPDRRGIGLRQVQAVLAERDSSATMADSLAGKSVALQGLGTLEYLLFGTGAEELATDEGAFRCSFAHAAAERVQATADNIADAWDEEGGISERFINPTSDNPDFQTQDDSLRALLGMFTNGLEMVADTHIAPFLGGSPEAARPKLAPWWRAGLTGDALAANLAGLAGLFEVSGLRTLLPDNVDSLSTEIDFEFANADRVLGQIERPLSVAVTTEGGYSSASYLLIVTRSLRSLFAERFAGRIGLVAGFSSLDGD